jgi:hypothetical protein
MPVDYLLGIMRNENQDARWRLDAPKAAAPYCHARLSATELSGPASEEELDVLERALRKTIATQERAS